MARILVVEDEKDLQEVLAYNLQQAGHTAIVVGSGRDALVAIPEHRPDLVLLDLMLPDVSGIEICRKLKSDPGTRDVPIVMVTAKGDEVDRVVGFELGADDYVVKPYSLRELLLRIDAVLRRASPTLEPAGTRGVLLFGRLRVDRDAHRVWVDDGEVTLTALELRLLSTLLERRGRVQSRAGASRRRLGHERRGHDPYRRHPRQAPAREAGWRRSLHRDRTRRRLSLHPGTRSRGHGRGDREGGDRDDDDDEP